MLTIDPNKRISASAAHGHPWFKLEHVMEFDKRGDGAISVEILKNLSYFKGRSHLRRASLNILVKMVNPKEFVDLRAAFNKIDKDLSGTIEASELK